MRFRTVLVLCAALALTVGVATANAGKGGNSANAKLCQKGGWQSVYASTGGTFSSEEACVSFAATGGTVTTTKPQSAIDCEAFGGTYDMTNMTPAIGTVLWACNGFAFTGNNPSILIQDCASGTTGRAADPTLSLGYLTCLAE